MENLDTVLSCLEIAKQTLNYTDLLEHSLHSKKKNRYNENKGGKKENQSQSRVAWAFLFFIKKVYEVHCYNNKIYVIFMCFTFVVCHKHHPLHKSSDITTWLMAFTNNLWVLFSLKREHIANFHATING